MAPFLLFLYSPFHLRVLVFLVVKTSHIGSSHQVIMPLKQPTYFSKCTAHKTISLLSFRSIATLHIVITLCMYSFDPFCFNKIMSCSSTQYCENLFLKENMCFGFVFVNFLLLVQKRHFLSRTVLIKLKWQK